MVADVTGNAIANLTGALFSGDLLSRTSNLITLFQAVGGLIIAYIIFNTINIFWNRRKAKEFEKMTNLLEQINKKLDGKKITKR